MVVKCQVMLTRKRLNDGQYSPEQILIIPDSDDDADKDSSFLDQAVELLVLIKKWSDIDKY